jgi:uncharacterized membrane protein YraQ (UPF0718 family)
MSLLWEFVAAFGVTIAESAPFVVLGFVVAGLLREFLPTDLIRRGVGGRGFAPVLRAVGVGALLPVCSCSTIPLGIGLARSGASTGTALAFMTSGPAVSPVTVALGWSLLGPSLLGWYTFVTATGALCLGFVGNQWLREVVSLPTVKASCGCGCEKPKPVTGRFAAAFHWAFNDLGAEVSQSLFIGLAAASLLLVALPSELVVDWLGQPSWVAIAVAIAVSLPAYTCSVPALVIASSLIAKGVDPGVAVAFLIAGPATNLGELNAIRSAFGMRAAAFYAASIIAIAFTAGSVTAWLPFDALTGLHAHAGHDHSHAIDSVLMSGPATLSIVEIDWWRWPFVAVVAALALSPIWRMLLERFRSASEERVQSESPSALPIVAIK